jgi:hypothetical protein
LSCSPIYLPISRDELKSSYGIIISSSNLGIFFLLEPSTLLLLVL